MSSQLTDDQLVLEKQRRVKGRKTLIGFTEYTFPRYVAARHHHLIGEHLDAVIAGDIKRLIIKTPPRHGKSELVSVRLPAKYLGDHPERQVMSASYNATLASSFGGQARDVVRMPEYQTLFPNVSLTADSKAKDTWRTKEGGIYVCGGIGFGSGFGADLLVIDDPVKTREEADSEVYRERAWNWYASTGRLRLMPGAAIVICYTPYHEDDIGGRLEREMVAGGEQWVILELPALIESTEQAERDPLHRKVGEPLWPTWYNRTALETIKRTIGPREWQALFQCRPSPESGDYFKREWFEHGSSTRAGRRYVTSDWAVSDSELADFTCHQVWEYDNRDTLTLIDVFWQQVEIDVGVDAALELIAKYKPMAWINEKGVIRKALGPLIRKRMRERGMHVHQIDYARVSDKVTFARPIQARMSGGFVKFDTRADWYARLQSEWLRFPAGQHDDSVDAAALIGHHLEQLTPRPEQTVFTAMSDFEAI